MKPGELGLIVLYGMVMALLLAYLQMKEDQPAATATAMARRKSFLQALSILALPFFIWAIVNTAEDDSLDLGLVSMGSVLLSTATAMYFSPAAMQWTGYFVLLSCLLTAANYGYVLFFVSGEPAFDFYAGSGLVVWVLCGITVLKLHMDVASEHRYEKISAHEGLLPVPVLW